MKTVRKETAGEKIIMSVSSTVNPRTQNKDNYMHEYWVKYVPLFAQGEPNEYIGEAYHYQPNPLEYPEHQPGYRIESNSSDHKQIRTWEVVRTDLFLPTTDDTLTGVIFCFCRVVSSRPRTEADDLADQEAIRQATENSRRVMSND
ncbi:MAG: hypothetical protein C6Y22_22175 [Hapalosiphonaceae cyanobacterium JJU2]|nr:MAG: hypothetical protein C6Y22_22175 [Hapalosiphonaceae cyanobacterium JJU2]